MEHPRPAAVLLAALLSLAACGGGTVEADQTTTTTAAVATTTTAGPAEVTPACDRFTEAELESALGQAFGEGLSEDDGFVCLWEANPSNQVGLTVRPPGGMSPEVLCNSIATPNSERLEVVGAPAVLEGRQIYVCTDGGSFNLLINVALGDEEMRTALIDLATIGAAR